MTQLVLVTGGTGLVGSHVVSQLLEKSYRVRAVARSASKLRGIFPDALSLEVVEMPTLTSDYSESLKGVDAVIHVAAPLFGKGASGDETFHGSYDGTLHIVHQSINAGIKKIIITGTYASLFDSAWLGAFGKQLVTEKFFHPVTPETLDLTQSPASVYQQSKTLAEKRVWELAKEHPDVDFTILLPSAIYGPLVPNYPASDSPNMYHSIGTNATICLIFTTGTGEYPNVFLGHVVDVRDVARAHVAALTAPPVPGRDKRFIISAELYKWKDVTDLLRRERPELASRLPKEDSVPFKQTDAPLDTSFAAEVLGMTEYITWEETVLAGIDAGVAWEKQRNDI